MLSNLSALFTLLFVLVGFGVTQAKSFQIDPKSCSGVFHFSKSREGMMGETDTSPFEVLGKVRRLEKVNPKDQMNTYECYLFSQMQGLEIFNRNQKDSLRREFEISFSSAYLYAWKLRVALFDVLEAALQKKADGLSWEKLHRPLSLVSGTPHEAMFLIRTFGLIPESSFRPLIPFKDWNIERLNAQLGSALDEAYRRFKRRRRDLENRGRFDQKHLQELLVEASLESEKIFNRFVLRYTGPLPQPAQDRFTFKGMNLNPYEWAELFSYPRDFVIHTESARNRSGISNSAEYKRISLRSVENPDQLSIHISSVQGVLAVMRKAIDLGYPAQVLVKWGTEGHGNHMLTLVGYEKGDSRDEIRSWIFQNSWGNSMGHKGEFHVMNEEVEKKILNATVIAAPRDAQKISEAPFQLP